MKSIRFTVLRHDTRVRRSTSEIRTSFFPWTRVTTRLAREFANTRVCAIIMNRIDDSSFRKFPLNYATAKDRRKKRRRRMKEKIHERQWNRSDWKRWRNVLRNWHCSFTLPDREPSTDVSGLTLRPIRETTPVVGFMVRLGLACRTHVASSGEVFVKLRPPAGCVLKC